MLGQRARSAARHLLLGGQPTMRGTTPALCVTTQSRVHPAPLRCLQAIGAEPVLVQQCKEMVHQYLPQASRPSVPRRPLPARRSWHAQRRN